MHLSYGASLLCFHIPSSLGLTVGSVRSLLVFFLCSLRTQAHVGRLQLLMTMTVLFTDMAGNTPFLIWLVCMSLVLWHLLWQVWLNSASQNFRVSEGHLCAV